MNLDEITPMILTFNEGQNIERCLERLSWAERVLVMDSGSTDATLAVCSRFSNVDVVERPFDSFAGQCNAGLGHITSEWVLSMDADYVIPTAFSKITDGLSSDPAGYSFPFRYCIHGKPLRACLYPQRTVLYKRTKAKYRDDGHGHRVEIAGIVNECPTRIDHDDRKPLSRWLDSQRKYAALEAQKMSRETEVTGMPDRLRRMIWPAAPAAFIYTLFAKRLIFDGWPGLFYALQRTYAELLLSLELLERRMTKR